MDDRGGAIKKKPEASTIEGIVLALAICLLILFGGVLMVRSLEFLHEQFVSVRPSESNNIDSRR
jgi:hypothetical protein